MHNNGLFFVWGNEAFLVDQEIKNIIRDFAGNGEEVEVEYVDVEDLSPHELLEKMYFSPLFTLQRALIIKNPYWLEKVRRRDLTQEIVQVFEEYLASKGEGQIVIISSLQHNTSNKIVSWLDKNARVIKCEYPGKSYLKKWIENEFQMRNKKVNLKGAHILAESGQDMYYILNLIEKIALFNEGEVISAADIEEELESKEEVKVFKFTDALLKRDKTDAFQAYYKLKQQGASPVFILYMTVRQFVSLAKVKYYLEKGYTRKQIEEKTGLKDFVVGKMSNYAHSYSSEELELFFNRFLEADIALKSGGGGPNEDVVMEIIISEICR